MLPLVKSLFITFLLFCFHLDANACIDSLWYQIDTVQCNGFRNGKIKVEQVFGGQAPYYYSIDGQSFSTNPTFDHLWAGEYILSVRDASGCVSTMSLNLTEPEKLAIRIQASDSSIIAGKPLLLRALISPENAVLKSILWQPTHLFPKQDTIRQQVVISETIDFSVEITNDKGCVTRNKLTVFVEQINIYFPNALKPGSAEDAYFTVYSGEGVQKVNTLMIYSRTGAQVFEQHDFLPNDPKKGWNGQWNGQRVQAGVYLWVAELVFLDGTLQRFDGSITVVE